MPSISRRLFTVDPDHFPCMLDIGSEFPVQLLLRNHIAAAVSRRAPVKAQVPILRGNIVVLDIEIIPDDFGCGAGKHQHRLENRHSLLRLPLGELALPGSRRSVDHLLQAFPAVDPRIKAVKFEIFLSGKLQTEHRQRVLRQTPLSLIESIQLKTVSLFYGNALFEADDNVAFIVAFHGSQSPAAGTSSVGQLHFALCAVTVFHGKGSSVPEKFSCQSALSNVFPAKRPGLALLHASPAADTSTAAAKTKKHNRYFNITATPYFRLAK
ncbi:MAG: hypothetical protein V8T87_16350 [Victivallales bacterium]